MAASKTPQRKNSSPSKAGRRTGENNTRNDILTAAKNLFAEHGFEGTSMRSIATRASVDPALIRHFFGNKEALFTRIITEQFALANQMRDSFQSGDSNRGRAIVSAYLQMWNSEDIKPLLLGLVRSAISSADTNSKMRDAAWELFSTGPFSPGKTNIDPIAFSLMSSQLLGLAVGRYLMELPHLTSLSDTRIINELSPVIQRYIDGTYTELDDAMQGGGVPVFAATAPLTPAAQSADAAEAEKPAGAKDANEEKPAASAEDATALEDGTSAETPGETLEETPAEAPTEKDILTEELTGEPAEPQEEIAEPQEIVAEAEVSDELVEEPAVTTEEPAEPAQPADAASSTQVAPSTQATPAEEPETVEAEESATPVETETTPASDSPNDALDEAADSSTGAPGESSKDSATVTTSIEETKAPTWEPEEILIAEELPVQEPTEPLPLDEAEDNSPTGEYQRPDALENAHEPTLFEDPEPAKPAPKKSKKKEPAEDQLSLFDGLF